MENRTQQHSVVFERLWNQVGSEVIDRLVLRARNANGQRALKIKTDSFHKALILETSQRPGISVRLPGFPEIPGLVSGNGSVTFVEPTETQSLQILIRQLDRWASSFETIFGKVSVDGHVPIEPSETTHSVSSEVSNEAANTQVLPEDSVNTGMDSSSDWDQVNPADMPHPAEDPSEWAEL